MVEKNDASSSRRFTDAAFATVIGPSISIRGEIRGEDAVDLAGTLDGDASVAAHFRVRSTGRVVGPIKATTLVVEGSVQAPQILADKIEIGATASVESCLRAQRIAIAEGATFDGEVHMHGAEAGGALTVFTEQRRSREAP